MNLKDLQKQKMNNIYSHYTQKMSEFFSRKKILITDFKHRLETRKINKLKDELIQK
jgi:hypothetical protein